ncbi:MAG: hypothetical protein R2725_00330 [Solirubrobacterales bacterium]
MSRIRIVTLLAALLALATGIAACGGDSEADPQEVMANATLRGVESGKFKAAVEVSSQGDSSGEVAVDLSGAFQKQAGEDLPQLALDLSAQGAVDGEDVDFEAGLTLLSDRAFVSLEGAEYEVDPTTFGYVKSSFEQQQAPEESEERSGACQEAAEEVLDLTELVEGPSNEGSADVEGQETTKISGDLNVAAVADAAIELSEDPGCASEAQAAGPLPLDELNKAKDEVTDAVKKAHADIYVGNDGIVRRVAAELVIAPQGGGRLTVDVDFTLSDVNEEQEFAEPSGAEPLEGLFQELGINPLELFEAGSSGGVTGLLEGLLNEDSVGLPSDEGSGGSGSSGGGSSGSGSGAESGGGTDLEAQQAYFECLGEAGTAQDLQKCASLAP